MQSYEFITVEEVAERLQVSRATIFNWMHMGIFSDGKHYFKRGRVLRFAWGDDLITTLMGGKQKKSENKAVVNPVRSMKTSPLNWDY